MLKDCKLPQFSVFRGVSHASEADIKKVVVWVFFVPHCRPWLLQTWMTATRDEVSIRRARPDGSFLHIVFSAKAPLATSRLSLPL